MLSVAVGYEMYEITQSAVWLGLAGLVQFLPKILFLFISGSLADKADRRKIAALSQAVIFVVCASLSIVTLLGFVNGPILLIAVFLYGTAFSIQGPSMVSLLPNLVSKYEFPKATAKVSSVQQSAIILGPVFAGFLLVFGAHIVYAIITFCNLTTILLVLSIRKRHIVKTSGEKSQVPESPLAGFRYIWQKKGIFGAISLDMFAVLFGGATALLPIFATDILHVDSTGFGFLRAAPAVGSLLMSLVLAKRPIRHRTGKIMFSCVAIWGVLTILFALSGNLVLSIVILVFMGMVDMVSVVIRGTYVQVTTEDEVRGRVSAVNMVFIGASNQLGEFESGMVAAIIGPIGAVIFGGIVALGITGAWYRLFPDLRNLDTIE
jgi:MFS family permease